MKRSFGIISGLAVLLGGAPLWAEESEEAMVAELKARVEEQVAGLGDYETLSQSYAFGAGGHDTAVLIGQGIEVVIETVTEGGVATQKDYYLHESKVYAYCLTRHEPALDGETKRVAQSWYLFHEGAPIRRWNMVVRVPLTEEDPDLSEEEEVELPVMPGLEGWGDELTARAFAIARTFRAGVGRHVVVDWEGKLMKDAPPAGSGEEEVRGKGWLPAEGTTVLPVQGSVSADGVYAVGWGFDKGPVDWRKLAYEEEEGSGYGAVTFSKRLGEGPFDGDLEEDGTYLIEGRTGKVVGKLGISYPGDRKRFNHDGLEVRWSPGMACVALIVSAKWETEFGHMAWIEGGKCAGSQDIMGPLSKAAREAAMKTDHPAAKRLAEEDDFSYTLMDIMVEDDGRFEALVSGLVPKLDALEAYFEVMIEGRVTPGEAGGSAVLEVGKAAVSPADAEE